MTTAKEQQDALRKAAAQRLAGGISGPGFGTQPGSGVVSKRVKGKYVGKEKYGGLTRNAPKGKYKGKYIGPDRFKGDAAAYQKYKDEKAAKKNQIGIGDFERNQAKKIKKIIPQLTAQPVGTPKRAAF